MFRASLALHASLRMASMGKSLSAPLIVIIGATGTGKSKLAVDLATRFNGEIVNGDAMQLYEGLPVITNKISVPERQGVPHHLLGCIGRDEHPWTVDRFVPQALRVIEEIRERGRLPVLVGGTHYYTQALLFRDSLVKGAENGHHQPDLSPAEAEVRWPILAGRTEDILAKLQEVDPIMANRWHPNDRRKISRSLEIWLDMGRRASDIYEEQQSKRQSHIEESIGEMGELSQDSNLDAETQSGMRFETLILWTHTEKEALQKRLNTRIKTMVKDGLLDEARSLRDFLKSETDGGKTIDQTRGIWVSIGYKELASYFEACDGGTDTAECNILLDEALERTEIHTRQYANYQIKWIRNKLIQALREVDSAHQVFVVDASDPSVWRNKVLGPAIDIVQRFLHGDSLPDALEVSPVARDLLVPSRDYDISHRRDLWIRQTCEVCDTVAVNEKEWEQHIKSRRHQKLVKAQKKDVQSYISDRKWSNGSNG